MVMFSSVLVEPEQLITCDWPAQSLTHKEPISSAAYAFAVKTDEDSLTSEATAILATLSSQYTAAFLAEAV